MKYLSKNYALPIPALNILAGLPGERPWLGPLTAILDTGADITAFPLTILNQLKAKRFSKGLLRSQWGDAHLMDFYFVELEIEGTRLANIQVATDKTTHDVTLGRNVINRLSLFLDGPQEIIETLDDATVKRLRSRRKLA
jgi:predicted aspartyl protease